MKPIKLEVGQIWQVPKTLDVRTIVRVHPKFHSNEHAVLVWSDIGCGGRAISEPGFLSWVTKTKAKLIGHYDLKKLKAIPINKKARAVK